MLISTHPKLSTCLRCSALTAVGYSGGIAVSVEPVPLSPDGVLSAIYAGREVYTFAHSRLVYMDEMNFKHGVPEGPVVQAHYCRGMK